MNRLAPVVATPPERLQKEHATTQLRGMQYVLSDESRDRYGEVIVAAGWKLGNFKKNPIALFGHRSDFPIGTWKSVQVENDRLVATLEFAAPGTSERIDEIRSLADQGILKTVSVGFRPIKSEPMNPNADPDDYFEPQRYLEQELLECSLVSVPANPNALQLARSLHVSNATLSLVFGASAMADEGMRRRGTSITGVSAHPPHTVRKTNNMTPLTKRIEDAQAALAVDSERLETEVLKDDASDDLVLELTGRVNQGKAAVERLLEVERALGQTSTPTGPAPIAPATIEPRRPFAAAAKKVEPKDYVYRGLAAAVIAHHSKTNPLEVLKASYGEDEVTRGVFQTITRAASAPAMTTTTGWAAELVQTAILDFIESLLPNSVYPRLSGIGGRFSFGQNGIVSLPSRSATPTIAGSFVGQGAPIPVRQGAFTATSLTPKKMAVITTLTREMAEHSVPQLEGVLRQAIQEDTAVAIDTVLLDATASSSIRPAGLRNGVTTVTATSGGGFAALVGDIKALVGALITASNGNIRNPVWIMNQVQALAIGLTQNAGGDFPFKAEVAGGTLQGYPLIQSSTVTAGMIILVDAADFFSATGDEPRFDVSDQATLHMEDTTPLALGTGTQGSGVLAVPMRSMFQTDSIAIRMLLDMNWALRRTGTLAWTSSVTW